MLALWDLSHNVVMIVSLIKSWEFRFIFLLLQLGKPCTTSSRAPSQARNGARRAWLSGAIQEAYPSFLREDSP